MFTPHWLFPPPSFSFKGQTCEFYHKRLSEAIKMKRIIPISKPPVDPERQYGSCSHVQIQDVWTGSASSRANSRSTGSISSWKLKKKSPEPLLDGPAHQNTCQHCCHLNFLLRRSMTPYWIRAWLRPPFESQKHCLTSLWIRSISVVTYTYWLRDR